MDRIITKYNEKEEQFGKEQMREFEKVIVLRAVDSKWMDHIDAMDQAPPRDSPSCLRADEPAS